MPLTQAPRALGAILAASALLALAPAPQPLAGFTASAAERERADEAAFLDVPSAAGALAVASELNEQPHYAGTRADHELALFALERLREAGFEARIEQFTSRVDTPRRLVLELYPKGELYVPATPFRRARGAPPLGLDLREQGDPNDPPTLDPAVGLPFNADAADGDVVAPLVYANRGRAEDFALLRRSGVDVRGAVALIRYGAAFRGELVRNAQAAGARGAILYDDPADDGAARGPAIPDGPWRPAVSVQRGALGDGVRIPVLPVSANNARTLLRALHGARGPAGWAGGLDAPYPVGRGPAFVHLAVELDRSPRTLWNTIGVLPGTEPGETVVLGAHRDAWVYGVGDNGAGTSVVLEAARGLGYLARTGRRARRTIVVALWDGEEIGLRGSADYVHAHADELRRGAIAYLNADENVTGARLGAVASGALEGAILDAARDVPDPEKPTQSLYARWTAQPGGITIREPGGGSDQVSFADAFGTPVAEAGFHGPFGPYHSSYDTLRYATTFSDPEFVRHRAAAQLYGLVALRLANADALPYTFEAYVPRLESGIREIEARAQHDGRSVDLAGLRAGVAAFAVDARKADRDAAAASGVAPVRALRAAQRLDALVSGTVGYASVPLPAIRRAYDAHDDTALREAIATTRSALAAASADLR
ncbi:MAG TPA: M28 family peptidase [Candidatus Baltobacteraceae bacterium]|nr:M28 family peptidase [Candidatus Baltobacteraceae bacterium]